MKALSSFPLPRAISDDIFNLMDADFHASTGMEL